VRGEMQTLHRDGEIFFFVVNGQGVERNLERRQGDIGRAAYQFKINRVLALYAFGKQLIAQEGNLMCQPVVPVIHAVDAALQYFFAATELLTVVQHSLLRFDQTQFPLTVSHAWGPEPTADWMLPGRS
jgi:hypothetical protein